MKILIKNGRVIDPAAGRDEVADLAVVHGVFARVEDLQGSPDEVIDAKGLVVAPGLVDLAVRLREPGHEHEGMLHSELQAAAAGGVTSLVCLPDTEPVLDEPGLVDMLRFRAGMHRTRVFPLGALTRGLAGEVLTEMVQLAQAGCVGFTQAESALANNQVLLRALQYAATSGYTVWLRAQDLSLGGGVAASGAVATRLGLSGVPVAAETIALHTIFELMRASGARVHICRLSSAAGCALVRVAKEERLPVTCDVSIHSLHLTDTDIGYFDSRMRMNPPLRQQRDRDALWAGLADGTIDALVSDHTPVAEDGKALPFAQAEPGATGLELLLSLALKWGEESGVGLAAALGTVTGRPAQVLGASLGEHGRGAGRIVEGASADLCIFDPAAHWTVRPQALRSQGRSTPFAEHELPGTVRFTLVGGQIAFQA